MAYIGKSSPPSGLESRVEGGVCQPGGPCNRSRLRDAARSWQPGPIIMFNRISAGVRASDPTMT